MSLTQCCRDQLSSGARGKGESYFRQGRVKIVSSDEGRLEARVSGSGTRPYNVSLDWDDQDEVLRAECSCPHYDEGNFCKHLWATLLAAEESGALPALSSRDDVELWHLDDDEDEDDWEVMDDPDDDEYEVAALLHRLDNRSAGLPVGRLGGGQRAHRTNARNWHGELAAMPRPVDQISRATEILGGDRSLAGRVHYIVDVAASAAAGALIVNLYTQTLRKNGQWGKIKPLKVRREELGQFSPEDQRALGLALGNYAGAPYGYGTSAPLHAQSFQQISQLELVPAVHEIVLPELCATGRFGWVLAANQPPEDSRPVTWDAGPPWEFRLAIEDDAAQKSWTIRGQFARDEHVVPLAEAVLAFSSGLVLFPETISRLTPPRDWRWLQLLRQRDAASIPYADRERLLAELWSAGEPTAERLPANLQAAVERPQPQGFLQVHAPPETKKLPAYHKNDKLYASVRFDYQGQTADLADPAGALVLAGEDRVILRDRDAEQRLAARLAELRCRPKERNYYYDPPGHVQFPQAHFGELVAALAADGWRVEAEGRLVRRPGEFRASITSGVDWFDLDAAVDFDGASASLPQLLAALQRNERFVTLDDGSQGLLPAEWLERYAPLAAFAEVEGDHLRFRPSQALLLDALLADRDGEVRVHVDRQFARVRQKLRAFAGVAPREAPPGFRGELRPYQKQGLGWLAFLADFGLGGCLADDMGLGKTVQVLAWLAARRRTRRGEDKRPSLVVSPKSVVFNWQLEAERFAPKLNVLNYTGLDRRDKADEIAAADLVLTTYGTLRKDVETLKDVPFDYLILDEAQAIKNDKSISAKSCRLLEARHRLALTGTPVENHLGDLWSLFEFLNPGMLGRSSALRTFARTSSNEDDENERTAALAALRRGLAPFILRRTKEQVLDDLPAKTEQTLHVDLLPADRKRYNELRDHYRASLLKRVQVSGMNAARMHVLEALLRLRQTACHAGLVDKKLVNKPSAKVETLLEQLAEVVDEGHKALVFSQFTSLLAIVRTELDKRGVAYEYLDGRTRDRQARVEQFQNNPACPLFLISLKAGGTGLNLTSADYVFLLDPWWNPAVEAQAIDRAHRIGQQRRVFAYRLVARDTVEEKIIDLQLRKRKLADAIISADGGALSGLSVEDLEALLS